MAIHFSTLAWKIPWEEEPGRLLSMESLRVGHDLATSLSLFTFMHWRKKWQPTPVSLPGESQGQRSLADYSPLVAKSQTGLKWLSTAQHIFEFIHWCRYVTLAVIWLIWALVFFSANWASWNQDRQENINNLRYANDTTLMAEGEEELKRLLKVKEESKKLA